MHTRYPPLALLGGLAFLAGPAAAQSPSSDPDWSGVERCASIADAGQRHLCLDDALAAMGLLSHEAAAEAATEQARLPDTLPRAGPTAGVAREWDHPPPAFAGLASSIRSARLIGRRHIEIVAEDGSRWRSTSSESFRRAPRAGAAFEAERGALGSYNCRIEESTYFKCEPVS